MPRFYAVMMLICALAAVCLMVIVAGTANAAETCGPRDKILKPLTDKYHEQARAAGTTLDGQALIELYLAKDGVTWTVLVTTTNGITCLIAAGKEWEEKPVAIEGTGL